MLNTSLELIAKIKQRFPNNPESVLRFLLIFTIVGASPTIIIHILSSHPFWASIKPWFSTEAWNYFSWWFTIFPEPAAGFFGIFLAFAVERRIQRKDFHKRVYEILPYIYLELVENYLLTHEAGDFNNFNYQQKRFNISAWDVFKEDIAKWREINVVPLIRIYYNLEKANRILNTQLTSVPQEAWTAKTNAERLLIEQISLYEDWYKINPGALEYLINVVDKYRNATNQEEIMKNVLKWVDDKKLSLNI